MNVSQFHRVAELFEEASHLPSNERERYLEEHCDGDGELRDEVVRLLASDERPHQVFDTPPTPARDILVGLSRVSEQANGVDEAAPIPRQIGQYDVIRRIGAGGMGAVYLVRQHNPSRLVALKVIRGTLAQPNLVGRFKNEANALARLQHPGIAQIIEAGTALTDIGDQPYFAMEFVDGEPITEYAARHQLDLNARLELMAGVCDAVHHAHRRGVLHRDLKPGNILVVDDGEGDARNPRPKILDFGVARIVTEDHDGRAGNTSAGQIVGTLAYMSPEQAAAKPSHLDQRSDVYSLGVVLYELLSGKRPLDVETGSVTEAVRVICEDEPPALGSVDRRLRGDVETIVGKAMAKEPQRRYDTALALAEDIRRYVRSEPIAARPASAIYFARRFVRRRSGLFISTASVVLAALATTAIAMLVTDRSAPDRAASKAEQKQPSGSGTDGPDPRDDATWKEYTSQLVAAEAALLSHDVNEAVIHLKDAPTTLRNWEWRHLANRIDRSIHQFGPFEGGVRALAANASGNRVAIGDGSGGVRIVDPLMGQEVAALQPGLTARITALAYSPAGDRLAAGDARGNVAIWALASADRPLQFAAHTGEIVGIGWGDDGQWLFTGERNGIVRRWDSFTGRQFGEHDCATDLRSLHALPGRDKLLIANEAAARVVGSNDFVEVANVAPEYTEIRSVAVREQGVFALGLANGNVQLCATDAAAPGRLMRTTDQAVTALALSRDKVELLAASRSELSLWETKQSTRLATLLGHQNDVTALLVLSNGYQVSADTYGAVRVWNRGCDTVRRVQCAGRDTLDVAVAPRGEIVAATQGRWTHLWNAAHDRYLHTITTSPAHIADLEFAPSGDELWLLNTTEKTLERRAIEDGELLGTIAAEGKPYRFALSPDGQTVAIGHLREGEDGRVEIVNIESGEVELEFPAHRGNVLHVKYSSDGRWLVTCGSDGMVQIWDGETLESIAAVKMADAEFMHAALSPDHSLLATATVGPRDQIQLWRTDTWEQVATLDGHVGQVNQIAFVNNGTRLASVSHDATLRLWDVPTGRLAATLHGHDACIWSLAVVADGKQIVTGGGDHTVRFWDG